MVEQNGKSNLSKLKLLRDRIPFLRSVPDNFYFQLDPSGFYLPEPAINRVRRRLEKQTGHFVMTYERGVFDLDKPIETHLCALLEGADLSPHQLDLLNKAEEITVPLGISLVVYRNPLSIINPQQSRLASLYEK